MTFISDCYYDAILFFHVGVYSTTCYFQEPSLFAVAKLLETGLVNLSRVEVLWRPVTAHLLEVCGIKLNIIQLIISISFPDACCHGEMMALIVFVSVSF